MTARVTRGGYSPRRGAEKHVKLVLTLPPDEKAAILEAAKGAPSVSAWVLARSTPPTRDPRKDPRAGDVVWDGEVAYTVTGRSGDAVEVDWSTWTLTDWRVSLGDADVLRVAP